MPAPNFFLVGAPKCGTTAISVYLRDHPNVFFCNPKEPCFWSDDMPGIRESYGINSVDQYLELFAGAGEPYLAVGEGSTNYLVSEIALKNILQFNAAARIIVLLRNPVDLVHSLHTHNCFSGWDDEPDFERAWARQTERAQASNVPKACLNPVMLQYKTVGNLGQQVKRAMNIVPSNQLLVVLHDDFRTSPGNVYRRILSFLDLPDDGRKEFPLVNEAMAARAKWLTRLLQSDQARTLTQTLKRTLKGPFYQFADRAKKQMSMKKQPKSELERSFRTELINAFETEVALLEELLDRDLSNWRS
ncbi:Sulfotransferase domain protein [Rubripirellula amarantea]|uniref:Sulfotransferase domain protein n=1 Tax=Rubripirellula amarantea TaxID=2527999 RepID=A0A5C5WXN3_9BACT|nr:sulfotransferase [Rubripirellula amarantea]TWT54763.1 Sulfotransferase domain protein [Rubripirellula amarantea]